MRSFEQSDSSVGRLIGDETERAEVAESGGLLLAESVPCTPTVDDTNNGVLTTVGLSFTDGDVRLPATGLDDEAAAEVPVPTGGAFCR